MSVSITWATSNLNATNNVGMTEPLDHGSSAAGANTTAQDIWLSHTGSNQITNCKFYLGAYSGTYSGGATAESDLSEILAWGNMATAAGFGGLQINMDAINSFATSWPTYDAQGSLGDLSLTFRSNVGDSATKGVLIKTNTSIDMVTDGIIPASIENWPNIRLRIVIPASESTLGVRQIDQKITFTYTS